MSIRPTTTCRILFRDVAHELPNAVSLALVRSLRTRRFTVVQSRKNVVCAVVWVDPERRKALTAADEVPLKTGDRFGFLGGGLNEHSGH